MGGITQATRRRLTPAAAGGSLPASGGHVSLWRRGGAGLSLRLALAAMLAVVAALAALALLVPARHDAPVASRSAHASTLTAAATLAVSRGLGADLAEYRIERSPRGFLARNPRQRLTASFGGAGATVTTREGAHARIALQGIGFGAALRPVAPARPRANENRVEYRRGAATEWFANGPAGVEQGFTIARQPAGAADGALTLALDVSGTLAARRGAAGGLVLSGAGGKAVLRYGDLSVSDASGRSLPAHMTVVHGRVLISIDARRARYPLTVDPVLALVGELYASGGLKEQELGNAIAVAGNTVVVGDNELNDSSTIRAGRAYVFIEGAAGWATATQVAELVASAPEKEEHFGTSVAISGNTIVVGAPGRESGSGVDAGAAYVFLKPAGGWAAEAVQHDKLELLNSEDVAEYEFGQSVAVSGETIVVGAPEYRDYVQNLVDPLAEGAAFVFLQPAGGWASAPSPTYQTANLDIHEAEGEEKYTHTGESVAITEQAGDQTIVVGAPGAQIGTEPSKYGRGAVFLYDRPSGGWIEPHDREFFPSGRLIALPSNEYAFLGSSVSASGGVIAAGARKAEVEGVKHGATYVFTAPTGGWSAVQEQTQAAELTNPGTSEFDEFGRSVAVEGSTVAVAGLSKNIFLFAMPSSGWSGEQGPSAEYTAGPKPNETGIFDVALGGGEVFAGRSAASPPEEKGAKFQGAVDVVPYAPLVVTDPGSGVTGHGVSLQGTLNPDQTTVTSCMFQYGTTTAYGNEIPCSSFSATGTASQSVTAILTGLEEGVTYHYRFAASNSVDTSYGADETFTPKAPAGGGETTTTPTTTTTTTNPTTTVAAPQVSPALACTTAQVALINVVQKGSRVLINGAARLVLAGKSVSIKLLGTHKTVATATIAADGTFSASAPLPPAKIRDTNLARYEASVGSLQSLALKLDRRMYMSSATLSGAHVLLSGNVTGSFKAGTVVKILLRVTCSKEDVVAKVKLTRSGKFTATVPAPTGAASQIAVYRATTSVLDEGHAETTYTLPTPPTA
jgi:hypothetical protein